MALDTFHEQEIKFAVNDSAVVPDLTSLPSVTSLTAPRQHNLSAIYYDTEDLRLTRAKITLRRRTGGTDDGWHLKLPGESGRLEMSVELGELEDGTHPIPHEIRELVRVLVRDEDLMPIAQVDNQRIETTLVDDEETPLAEFCDDHVTAWSFLPGGAQTAWREWEVELAESLAGTDTGQVLLARATSLLISAGAHVSASPSKLVSALGASRHNAPLPLYLQEPNVDEDSAAAGVVAALAANRDKLLEYDPKVRLDEWDSVHQMRVATRELRSHLETFDGVLAGPELKEVRSELRILAGILGRARDAEVVEERFHELLDTEDSDTLDEATREHLRHDMGTEYRRAHRQVIGALNSQRYREMLDQLDEIIAYPPLATEGVPEEKKKKKRTSRTPEDILLKHLDQAYDRLLKRHRKAVQNWDNQELSLHEREEYFHDMRKSAKKLRYAAEAVGAATPVKTKRLYNACKDIQSSLGDFQDSVTSRDKLLELAQAARRRGEDTFGYGLLYQRERHIGLEALEEYSDGVKKIKAAYARLHKKRA